MEYFAMGFYGALGVTVAYASIGIAILVISFMTILITTLFNK